MFGMLLLLLLLLLLTFMQEFSNYVPERNYPSEMHNISSILLFKYMVHVMLFPTRKGFFKLLLLLLLL